MRSLFFAAIVLVGTAATGQTDSAMISRIFEKALSEGQCYQHLEVLCKQVGPRLSGSANAAKAVEYTHQVMEQAGFQVFRQEVEVPHWERGAPEKLVVSGSNHPFRVAALGGSVPGKVTGEVVEVMSIGELEKMGEKALKGKIIFFNRPMDPRTVYTFGAYGTCVDQRVFGAVAAARYGATAVIVRSMSLKIDTFPHTGSVIYADTVPRIPALAISTRDAEDMSAMLLADKKLKISLELHCRTLPEAISANVVGEIKGSRYPQKYIAVGGHLDSWDLGEGAHDDGAGCVQAIEALRLLKSIGYVPRHTLRAVMFMNEENGLRGAVKYARLAADNKEVHVAALESDRGGFSPRGFFVESSQEQLLLMKTWGPLFETYGTGLIKSGGAGADISPLRANDEQTILVGFVPDSQRYFDYHHAASDVFEAVNQRELELGAASLAAMIYLLDNFTE